MSSSMMTHRIRIKTQAQDIKVQQQNRQAKSYVALRSATGCNPQYTRLIYPRVCPYQCALPMLTTIIFTGGSASIVNAIILNGGNAVNTSNIVYNGNI